MARSNAVFRRILVCAAVLTVVVGGIATPGVAADDGTVDEEETGPVDASSDADPDNGILLTTVSADAGDHEAHSIVICDLSDGTVTACAVYNDPPITVSEVAGQAPEDVQDELDGDVIGLVDLTIRDPQSGTLLLTSIVNGQLPEESPIGNMFYPGYPITKPPVNLADPDGSLDPAVEQRSGGSPTATGAVVRVNDEVHAGGAPSIDPDRGVVRTSLDASDGHNDHWITVSGTGDGVVTATDGPVNGTAVLGETDQYAIFVVDLGGQPYIVAVNPDVEAGSVNPSVGPYNEGVPEEESSTNEPADETQPQEPSTDEPADGAPEDESTPTTTPGEARQGESTPTTTPDETRQGESTPTTTPNETRQGESTSTATPDGTHQQGSSTATPEEPSTPAGDDVESEQPGFGVAAGVLAILASALLARRSY